MKEKTIIHIISHNHWDREWIFTAKYTNLWLRPFFENLFKTLEEQPEYKFVLDGQTLIIEDYLNLLPYEEAKLRESQIKKYVQEGRLLIGPAYLQPDWSLVSGESLVRNLLIGCQMCMAYGKAMKVGWMLDNFGQIAQVPQIYQGFGIEGAFVWRGIEMDPKNLKTEFWWEAPNKSRILGVYLINSYRNAMVLSLTREIAKERIISQAEALRSFASTPNVLLMNGYEQVPWPDDVLPIIKEVNREIEPEMHCLQSTPPEYLKAVLSYHPELPTLSGYFYSGKFAPILKGVYSSRSHLNLMNNECQRELERWAEPFATLCWIFGGEYPHRKLLNAWKTLLLNHTHDDICGCCVDTIARDMVKRFEKVYTTASDIATESLRTLAQTIDTSVFVQNEIDHHSGDHADATAVVVFNPSSRTRSEVVGYTLEIPEDFKIFSVRSSNGKILPHQVVRREGKSVDLYFWAEKVPALGYKTFYVVRGNRKIEIQPRVQASARDRVMENEFLKVKINRDGTLTITEKSSGTVYENLGYFEDGGDAGDTYDYSYPPEDKIISSRGKKARVQLLFRGPLFARFKITYDLKLPASLRPDRKARSEEWVHYPVISYVELAAGARQVEIRTVLLNVAKDHRLRALFPVPYDADFVYAEEPFDVARFSVAPEAKGDQVPEEFDNLLIAGHYTVPVNTHPFQNFVGLQKGRKGLAVISRRLTEFEVLHKNTIAITLLRSVGWLARYDLQTRVGDVGPHIFTPEAQCLGKHVFAYAIYPYHADFEEARPHFQADIHNLKLRAVQTDLHRGHLADELSLLGWVREDHFGAFRITCLKRAEDSSGIILRCYNTLDKETTARLRHWGRVTQAYGANLKEEVVRSLPMEGDLIRVDARPKEIVTLKLNFTPLSFIIEPDDERTRKVSTLLPSEDLPPTPMPPVITREEVLAEKNRMNRLKKQLSRMRNKVFLIEDEIERAATKDIHKLMELQRVKSDVATLTRQLYECRISYLLNHELYIVLTIENELEEMGEQMSWSRIKKRVGEYLMHYFEQLARNQANDH